MSIQKLIFALSILFVIGSCAKEEKEEDTTNKIKESYIGTYTFEYTYSSDKFSSLGIETGTDTTYSETRTISVKENEICNEENELSFVNILGKGLENCFTYTKDTYVLINNFQLEGEGTLEGENLSINFRNIGASTQFEMYRIYGTAIKN
ncbi:MAG: hypothetical protein ACI8ZX_001836 [Planctomycetota bacterium]|jgi:hypothetical protein